MSNNSHHFKFTKKENPLKNSTNENTKKTNKKERKHSELLIKILNSNVQFNNDKESQKSQTIYNKEKKSLFNKYHLNYRNRGQNLKVEFINNLTNIQKNTKKNDFNVNNSINMNNKIFDRKKTGENKKTRIKKQKLDEIKAKIKHNLDMNLENKFSFFKINKIYKTMTNINIKDSKQIKNKIKENKNIKYIMQRNNNFKYRLRNTAIFNKYFNKISENKVQKNKNLNNYLNRTKTEDFFSINNLDLSKVIKLKKKPFESLTFQLSNPKNNRYYNYSYKKEEETRNKLSLTELENINSKIDINAEKNLYLLIPKNNSSNNNNQKKEILYFNFDKNKISSAKKEENKNQEDISLISTDIAKGEFKNKKIFIMLNDSKKNEIPKHTKKVFHSPPKKLLDTIRTIKKLINIEKVEKVKF